VVDPIGRDTRACLPSQARILDISCGFGRHSVWPIPIGYAITAVAIKKKLGYEVVSEKVGGVRIYRVVV
jgi:hypothetical protein